MLRMQKNACPCTNNGINKKFLVENKVNTLEFVKFFFWNSLFQDGLSSNVFAVDDQKVLVVQESR